jgi:hypothetical protein
MNTKRRLAIATMTHFWVCVATAQSVYKSIDAQGRVTYSSTPPLDAPEEMIEEVRIAPGPTEQQRRDAMRRAKELQEITRRTEQEREERAAEAAQALSDARLELRNAEAALSEARIKREDDWELRADRGHVLKPAYHKRVEAAERGVQEAEKAVRRARRAPR